MVSIPHIREKIKSLGRAGGLPPTAGPICLSNDSSLASVLFSDTIGNAPVVKQGRFPEKVFLLLMGCSKNYNVLGFTSIIIPRVSADVCTNITKSVISFCAV